MTSDIGMRCRVSERACVCTHAVFRMWAFGGFRECEGGPEGRRTPNQTVSRHEP